MTNPILLADTPTPDLTQYHLEYKLTASCWSTGLTKREMSIQYYKSKEVYAG